MIRRTEGGEQFQSRCAQLRAHQQRHVRASLRALKFDAYRPLALPICLDGVVRGSGDAVRRLSQEAQALDCARLGLEVSIQIRAQVLDQCDGPLDREQLKTGDAQWMIWYPRVEM
jgi:hypothetical protein